MNIFIRLWKSLSTKDGLSLLPSKDPAKRRWQRPKEGEMEVEPNVYRKPPTDSHRAIFDALYDVYPHDAKTNKFNTKNVKNPEYLDFILNGDKDEIEKHIREKQHLATRYHSGERFYHPKEYDENGNHIGPSKRPTPPPQIPGKQASLFEGIFEPAAKSSRNEMKLFGIPMFKSVSDTDDEDIDKSAAVTCPSCHNIVKQAPNGSYYCDACDRLVKEAPIEKSEEYEPDGKEWQELYTRMKGQKPKTEVHKSVLDDMFKSFGKKPSAPDPNQMDIFSNQGNMFEHHEGDTKQFGPNDTRKLETTQGGKKRWVDADSEEKPKNKPDETPDWNSLSINEQIERTGLNKKVREHPLFEKLKTLIDEKLKKKKHLAQYFQEPTDYLTSDFEGGNEIGDKIAADLGFSFHKGTVGDRTLVIPKPSETPLTPVERLEAKKEGEDHADILDKVKEGEIKTPEELGAAIEQDHVRDGEAGDQKKKEDK